MKNGPRGKRRDRKTGISPYVKYGKMPYPYTKESKANAAKGLKDWARKQPQPRYQEGG